jgi:putative flippase GtrA
MTEEETKKDVKTSKLAGRYLIIGIILTVFNYILYTILARIINNNNILWVSTLISTTFTIFLAYILHSRITWKERDPGKLGVYKFFIWNIIIAVAISPFLTWVFSLITPLYEFAYNISSAIHLPFDYDFVQSTGAFVLTTIITMILNFLFYDKFVFGKKKEEEKE